MKNKYTVYFEIFGKKLKTEVIAKDEHEARMKVLCEVRFHQVINNGVTDDEQDIYDTLKNLFK